MPLLVNGGEAILERRKLAPWEMLESFWSVMCYILIWHRINILQQLLVGVGLSISPWFCILLFFTCNAVRGGHWGQPRDVTWVRSGGRTKMLLKHYQSFIIYDHNWSLLPIIFVWILLCICGRGKNTRARKQRYRLKYIHNDMFLV